MANDFSADNQVVALYNFESGGGVDLTSDTSPARFSPDVRNTLVQSANAVTSSAVCKQGATSAHFTAASSMSFYLLDANATTDFPGKASTTNRTVSAASWFLLHSTPGTAGGFSLCGKYQADSKRSWVVRYLENGGLYQVALIVGTGTGTTSESVLLYSSATALSLSTWYHLGVNHNGSTGVVYGQILAENGTKISDSTVDADATISAVMNCEDAKFAVGCSYNNTTARQYFWDGLIDELVITKDILSESEMNSIRAGTYSVGVENQISATPGDDWNT